MFTQSKLLGMLSLKRNYFFVKIDTVSLLSQSKLGSGFIFIIYIPVQSPSAYNLNYSTRVDYTNTVYQY